MEKEAQAMRDYLAEYGSYEKKKWAITEEYEKRIREAATDGEKDSLRGELKKKLSDLDLKELKDGLNWEAVFGDLDKVSSESLQSLRTRLKEYIDTQKDLQPDSLKDLVRAIDSIDKKLSERNPFAALESSMSRVKSTRPRKPITRPWKKGLKPSRRTPGPHWMPPETRSRGHWPRLRMPCTAAWGR